MSFVFNLLTKMVMIRLQSRGLEPCSHCRIAFALLYISDIFPFNLLIIAPRILTIRAFIPGAVAEEIVCNGKPNDITGIKINGVMWETMGEAIAAGTDDGVTRDHRIRCQPRA